MASRGKSGTLVPVGLPGPVTAVSLVVPAKLSEKETVKALRLVGDLHRATPFWAGSLLLHAEARFGERVGQIAEALGWSPATVSNVMAVCQRIPVESRREELSFAHHASVAYLDPQERDLWLERAVQGDGPGAPWSSRALRQAIKGPTEEADEVPCTRCKGTGVEP